MYVQLCINYSLTDEATYLTVRILARHSSASMEPAGERTRNAFRQTVIITLFEARDYTASVCFISAYNSICS